MRGSWAHRWFDPLRLAAYAVCLFVALPILVVLASSMTAANYVTFPPQGLSVRWYGAVLRDAHLLEAVRVSVTVAVATAVLAVGLGFGATVGLERYRFPGRALAVSFVMAPLALPTIVLALGMLFFMSVIGLVGSASGLVMGHLVVALPYAVRALSASLGGVNRDIERSAAVLGAPPAVVAWKVTLPLMRPGVIAAFIFAFLVSFNNVSISLFIAGPTTQTLPLTIFRLAQDVQTPTLAALGALVMCLTTVVVVVLEKSVGLYGMLERQRYA